MRHARAFICILVLGALGSAACGGSPNSPSSQPTAARNLSFSIAPTLNDNDVTLTWVAAANVSTSQLQIGTATGQSSVLQTDVTNATSFDWHVQPGTYFVRISSTSGSTNVTSSELIVSVASLKDVIEAFFLGTGPLSLQTPTGAWLGAPRGSAYQLVVKSDIPLGPLQLAIGQISKVTNNQVTVTTSTVDSLPAAPGSHQILINDDLTICPGVIQPGLENVIGVTCSILVSFSNGFLSADIGLTSSGRTQQVELHELCHAIFVAQHIATNLGNQDTVMSPTSFNGDANLQFSNYEVAAIQAVYNSSVSPGINTTRAVFQAAGLVK
jgi:hypothetical protein